MKDTIKRDYYGAIIDTKKIVKEFSTVLTRDYIDLDRKGRGTCLNHSLYGYDLERGLAIVQARQYYKRAASHFGATRKTYFLIGKNEITGKFFRHPVSALVVKAAIRKDPSPESSVKAAQRWIFGVTERQLKRSTRQGDVLLVPEKPKKDSKVFGHGGVFGGSHRLIADEMRKSGEKVYALNPRMMHSKNQHAPVELQGWYSIRVGREAKAWDFSERIGD